MIAFSGLQKRREQKDILHNEKEKTLALKVKKMSAPTKDFDEEDADDRDLAMIIKSMKFWKNHVLREGSFRNSRGNSSRGSSGVPHQGISRT